MFAAPVLIDRSMTNFSARVGGNGKRIKSKMAARYKEKRTSITTVRDQYLSSATFPTPLIFHYPLPLTVFPGGGASKSSPSSDFQSAVLCRMGIRI